jgi:hypothetical protein
MAQRFLRLLRADRHDNDLFRLARVFQPHRPLDAELVLTPGNA